MDNKYNLDFYKTMEVANEYLDVIEDNINELNVDDEMIYNLEDKLFMYLERGDHQSACNQLVMNEMIYILIKDVLPENDLEYISDYLESMSEAQLVEEVTRVIDNYNK